MCMIEQADPADTYHERIHRARKEHRCCECLRTIKKGEYYQNTFTALKGKAEVFKTCAHCLQGQEWLRENCGGWLYGGIEADLEDHIEGSGSKVYRIIIGMRRQWKRFKNDELMRIDLKKLGIL